jgi:hypothetical protein
MTFIDRVHRRESEQYMCPFFSEIRCTPCRVSRKPSIADVNPYNLLCSIKDSSDNNLPLSSIKIWIRHVLEPMPLQTKDNTALISSAQNTCTCRYSHNIHLSVTVHYAILPFSPRCTMHTTLRPKVNVERVIIGVDMPESFPRSCHCLDSIRSTPFEGRPSQHATVFCAEGCLCRRSYTCDSLIRDWMGQVLLFESGLSQRAM